MWLPRILIALGAACVATGCVAGLPDRPEPIAYFSFEAIVGGIVDDESGHGHHATVTGQPQAMPGVRGQTLNLPMGSELVVASLSGTQFPPSGTLSFWVKADFTTAQPWALFDGVWADTRAHIMIRHNMERPLGVQVAFQGDPLAAIFAHNMTVKNQEWNHIVVVWDTVKDRGQVFLNGDRLADLPIMAPRWVPDQQNFRHSGGFPGMIDELRLFDRPLSPEEVLTLP